MKNFLKPVPDPVAEAELDHVLQAARCFIEHGRPVPSDIVMRAIALHRHWSGRDIPAVIVTARDTWMRAVRDPKAVIAEIHFWRRELAKVRAGR